MLVLRSALFNFFFYAFIVVALVLYLPSLLLPRRIGWPLITFWGTASLWMLRVIVGLRVEVRGRENIPKGGYIVAAKHQSVWETFALLPEFPDPTFILKRELTWIPLFGWLAIKMKMIPVDRGKGAVALAAMTEHARAAIAAGRQILIFPEGTRRPAGAEPVYKYGVAHLYRDLNCQVLPVALNSGLFWPRRTFLRYPGTVVVEFLPPIPPGLPANEFIPVLRDRLEPATDALLVEAAQAPNPPPRARDIAAAIAARNRG